MRIFSHIRFVLAVLCGLFVGVSVFAQSLESCKIATISRNGILKTVKGQRYVFAGVDLVSAPELYEFRQDSLAHIRELIKGQQVFFRLDPTSRGKAGARGIYLYLSQDATDSLNFILIKTGWVEAAYGRPYEKTEKFLNAQSTALEAKAGLWKYKKTDAATMGVSSVNQMGKAQKILSSIN